MVRLPLLCPQMPMTWWGHFEKQGFVGWVRVEDSGILNKDLMGEGGKDHGMRMVWKNSLLATCWLPLENPPWIIRENFKAIICQPPTLSAFWWSWKETDQSHAGLFKTLTFIFFTRGAVEGQDQGDYGRNLQDDECDILKGFPH